MKSEGDVFDPTDQYVSEATPHHRSVGEHRGSAAGGARNERLGRQLDPCDLFQGDAFPFDRTRFVVARLQRRHDARSILQHEDIGRGADAEREGETEGDERSRGEECSASLWSKRKTAG
jgi:hypothetical protein